MNENKDLGSAAVRGEAVAETNLAAAMLSIPVEVPFEHQGISQRKAYMAGAEQVRAKAAGLVSARAADALSEPSEQALWDDNGEPMNDAAEKEWRQCNERIRQRAADALDSQPTERASNDAVKIAVSALKEISEWRFGWDGDCGVTAVADAALEAIEAAQASSRPGQQPPTDGGVRNG